jgi:FHS family L-fucose permease-like MFS transporter
VDPDAVNVDIEPTKKLFQHRHFVWAAIAQFFNVAAQGGTWAFFINYGVEKMHCPRMYLPIIFHLVW